MTKRNHKKNKHVFETLFVQMSLLHIESDVLKTSESSLKCPTYAVQRLQYRDSV